MIRKFPERAIRASTSVVLNELQPNLRAQQGNGTLFDYLQSNGRKSSADFIQESAPNSLVFADAPPVRGIGLAEPAIRKFTAD